LAQAHASRAGTLGPQTDAETYASAADAVVSVNGEVANKKAAHAAAVHAAT